MSRVLGYAAPGQGHLFPLVAVLLELQRRGHEIALRANSSDVASMRGLGFDAAPIAAEVEALESSDWRPRFYMNRARLGAKRMCERARYDAPDLLAAIEEVRPDALLVDCIALGALSAAEAWGGPWAMFAPFSLPIPSRFSPPAGPGWRPARGPVARQRDRLARAVFRKITDRTMAPMVNSVRADLGLEPFRHSEDLFVAPPLVLQMSAEPFEYPRDDWPPHVVMVGPCLWEPAGGLPDELARVEAPLALVTTSSEFQNDGCLVDAAVEALAGGPLHVVATMPAVRPSARLRASGATVLGFAPHRPILERAACAITHGGMGVTQKALASGVPVCAVPFARDQAEVARRVEISEAGTRLPLRRLSADRLRRKVDAALECRPGAERVAAAFARAGGSVTAADAFEGLLSDSAKPAA